MWTGHISVVIGATDHANEHSGFIQDKQFLQTLSDSSLIGLVCMQFVRWVYKSAGFCQWGRMCHDAMTFTRCIQLRTCCINTVRGEWKARFVDDCASLNYRRHRHLGVMSVYSLFICINYCYIHQHNSLWQSPWEASCRSAVWEIPAVLWELKRHHHVYNSPPLDHILCRLNPVYTYTRL